MNTNDAIKKTLIFNLRKKQEVLDKVFCDIQK